MPDEPSATDNIARLFPGAGRSGAEASPGSPPASIEPTASDAGVTDPAEEPKSTAATETDEPKARATRPRRRRRATEPPAEWTRIMTIVPEFVITRNRTQMRKKRIGLEEGKSPGQQYLFGVKLVAVERILGDSLDTTGFVFGQEQQAIERTEEAILEAAEKILAERAKDAA